MSKFTQKSVFIGIDISKDDLDFAVMTQDHIGQFEDLKVSNNFKGFQKVEQWLSKKHLNLGDCLFCMEHTGTYGLLLFTWLSQLKVDFVVEPALKIKRSIGITRGKNDRIDARRIAEYACINKVRLEGFSLSSSTLLQIKQLLTYRDQLTRISTSLKNSIKSHQEYEHVSGLTSITTSILEQIKDLAQKIQEIEDMIMERVKSDPVLHKNYKLATSVKGIGFVIATFMLVTTNNFTAFENSRKYACYSGIAPFEHTSGSSIRGTSRVSNLANKKMKSLLSNGANAAYKHDPEIKNYYKRKLNEGKEHKLIINSICCKLVNRVFAVIKRQSPFVSIYQQNFI